MQPPERSIEVAATFRSSIIMTGSGELPEFVITGYDTPMVAMEFSTTPAFTPGSGYFHSLLSAPLGGIRLQLGTRSETGPAGTQRVRYVLPRTIYKQLSTSSRIYYRALAFNGIDPLGVPENPRYTWERPTRDQPGPPFIVILGTPPKPAVTIKALAKLKLAEYKLVTEKSTVDKPAEVTLRGINISQFNHRQYNWPQPLRGTKTCPPGTKKGNYPPPDRCPLDATRFHEAAGITRKLFEQLGNSKCGVVRLTFNQDWVLNGLAPPPTDGAQPSSRPAEDYLADLDQVIAWAAEFGIRVILALHTLHILPAPDRILYEAYLPDALSMTCWRLLNLRYRETPNVLFDLCNEPHERGKEKYAGCYTGIVPRSGAPGWIELWHDWVRRLEEGIHHQRDGVPERLLLVSGMYGAGYAASLRHMPVRKTTTAPSVDPSKKPDRLPNIIYAPHAYADYCDTNSKKAGDDLGHWLDTDANNRKSTDPATPYPVLIAEWGPAKNALDSKGKWAPQSPPQGQQCGSQTKDHLTRIKELAAKLKPGQLGAAAYLVGWTAWGFGDGPDLDAFEFVDIACCYGSASEIKHRLVTTTASGERELTDWGKLAFTTFT